MPSVSDMSIPTRASRLAFSSACRKRNSRSMTGLRAGHSRCTQRADLDPIAHKIVGTEEPIAATMTDDLALGVEANEHL